MHDWLPLVVLILGSGVGVTGLKVFFSLGKKENQLDEREKTLAKLEKKVEDHDDLGELARTLARDVTALKDTVGALSHARALEAVEEARQESDVLHRLEAVEKDLRRIQRFFSNQYPRVSLASTPDLDTEKEK